MHKYTLCTWSQPSWAHPTAAADQECFLILYSLYEHFNWVFSIDWFAKHTVSTNAHCAHMEAYPSAHPTAAADQDCFLMVGRVKISSPCTDTNLFLNTSFEFYVTRVFDCWTLEHVGPE